MRSDRMGPAALLLLAGCGGPAADTTPSEVAIASPTVSTTTIPLPPPAEAVVPPPESASATDAWLGRWAGVEGLVLTIARGDRPATYRLHIVLLDGAADYIGITTGDTIRFERDGKMETIRAVTGDETGLKWLAGRRDCLVIRPGEGFCRG